MYTSLEIYNLMISREINLRPGDLSNIFNNPNTYRYIRRLVQKDGTCIHKRIKDKHPILQIITHQSLGYMKVLFDALNSRLKIIESVRHLLFLIDHWLTVIDRYGNRPQSFSNDINYYGQSLPWYSKGWEERYLSLKSIDKVIFFN